jgi:glycosyltransferase involved in cell wall biosynthesis
VIEIGFAVPGDLATPTGGYAYARHLMAALPGTGIRAHPVRLPGTFPRPSSADIEAALRALSALPPDWPILFDGLAFGAMPAEAVRRIAPPIVALVHHPLGHESGLAADERQALLASEAAALALARQVVVTSTFTARLVAAEFAVPPERITVAEPGTAQAARAKGTGAPVALLAVGAVTPRKGYELLVEALAPLNGLDWRLTIAGALDRSPQAAAALRQRIAAAGLKGRIRLPGSVSEDALAALYDAADLFVSPSLFEGYGMALAEALVRGLPLVASTGGAAADTVPDGAAVKVEPGDVAALREALRRLITRPADRAALAEAALVHARTLPTWADTAACVAGALRAALAPELVP